MSTDEIHPLESPEATVAVPPELADTRDRHSSEDQDRPHPSKIRLWRCLSAPAVFLSGTRCKNLRYAWWRINAPRAGSGRLGCNILNGLTAQANRNMAQTREPTQDQHMSGSKRQQVCYVEMDSQRWEQARATWREIQEAKRPASRGQSSIASTCAEGSGRAVGR